jgi:hypothetical protein
MGVMVWLLLSLDKVSPMLEEAGVIITAVVRSVPVGLEVAVLLSGAVQELQEHQIRVAEEEQVAAMDPTLLVGPEDLV